MFATICCVNSYLICDATILSLGHDYNYSGYGYCRTTGFTRTNVVSHTLFGDCLVFILVWHVCLHFSNIGNSCQ